MFDPQVVSKIIYHPNGNDKGTSVKEWSEMMREEVDPSLMVKSNNKREFHYMATDTYSLLN